MAPWQIRPMGEIVHLVRGWNRPPCTKLCIGRVVSNVTLCPQVSNISFMFINFRWPSLLYCGFAVIICLINPLEGLLVRSYCCICTSCVSFVNAFRHCRVITAHCVRSCAFLLSHAMRLWLPTASNPVDCRTTYGFSSRPVLGGKR